MFLDQTSIHHFCHSVIRNQIHIRNMLEAWLNFKYFGCAAAITVFLLDGRGRGGNLVDWILFYDAH